MIHRRGFTAGLAAALTTGAGRAWSGEAPQAEAFARVGAQVLRGYPRGDGFWMPAEWEAHAGTLMQFPTPQNWYRGMLEEVRSAWAHVANTIAGFEPVTVAVRPADRARAAALLSGDISLIDMPLNDAWARDTGPLIVVNRAGLRRVAGFRFNGWGRRFTPFARDALAKARFAAHLKLPVYPSAMVLEGGAVTVDGQGTVLSTWESLAHPARNPGWPRVRLEAEVLAYLGGEKLICLPRGLVPDAITEGHVDRMAAFVAPGAVLLHQSAEKAGPLHRVLQDARETLEEARDAQGRRFEVIPLPLTNPLVAHMNFYICNGAVIVPLAEDPALDDGPMAVLRESFPRHQVIGVPGQVLASGGAGVHALAMQVPAAG